MGLILDSSVVIAAERRDASPVMRDHKEALREAFPYDTAPKYLIHGRDS